jgi:hypothetical protein
MLIDPPAETFIIADAIEGDTSIGVANITNFAINQILLIGEVGNQNSEIIKTSASVAPASQSIELASALIFDHAANTPVTVLRYDQVEFSTATTVSGVKSVLATSSIPANQETTDYNDAAASSGFYFARWKNTITSGFSSYSEASPVTAYDMFSARAVIDAALNMINKQTSDVLTDEFAFQMIDACQMEVLREFKRWSFMQSFETIIGTTEEGTWKIAVPANLDDQVTYKSIWNFRIGKEQDMVWVDKSEFDALIEGMAISTLSVAAVIGAPTLTLVSSKDFDTQGSIQVGPTQYTFTANNKTTNVLTLDGLVTANAAAGQDVFQFANLGLPIYWTIYGGFIYHWPITSSIYSGRNYYMDYYKKLVETTSDYDSVILPDPTVVQYYLAWKFLIRMQNGDATPASDGMFTQYIIRRDKLKQKESVNRNFILGSDLQGPFYW